MGHAARCVTAPVLFVPNASPHPRRASPPTAGSNAGALQRLYPIREVFQPSRASNPLLRFSGLPYPSVLRYRIPGASTAQAPTQPSSVCKHTSGGLFRSPISYLSSGWSRCRPTGHLTAAQRRKGSSSLLQSIEARTSRHGAASSLASDPHEVTLHFRVSGPVDVSPYWLRRSRFVLEHQRVKSRCCTLRYSSRLTRR
jgi:hypothetical protein